MYLIVIQGTAYRSNGNVDIANKFKTLQGKHRFKRHGLQPSDKDIVCNIDIAVSQACCQIT